MLKLIYEFGRCKSINGFFKTNLASTDTLSVLSTWEIRNKNWSYKILSDQDHQLIAELSIGGEDLMQSGLVLESLCETYGIMRKFIS